MKNPFKVGDVVFHATHGEGVVEGTNMPNHVKENNRTILVRFENSPMEELSMLRQYAATELSFKPWPAPCHERPIEDGWYVVSYNDSANPYPHVRLVKGGHIHFQNNTFPLSNYTIHKYIGKDWK